MSLKKLSLILDQHFTTFIEIYSVFGMLTNNLNRAALVFEHVGDIAIFFMVFSKSFSLMTTS
jgi:hypothetical protein